MRSISYVLTGKPKNLEMREEVLIMQTADWKAVLKKIENSGINIVGKEKRFDYS